MLRTSDQNVSKADKVKSERNDMTTDAMKAMGLMHEAFPHQRYGKLDNLFYEAKRFVEVRVTKQITIRRMRAIWEGQARRIDAEEMEALREAKLEQARREQQELRRRLAKLDAYFAAVDPDFHGAQVAAQQSYYGGLGGSSRAGMEE